MKRLISFILILTMLASTTVYASTIETALSETGQATLDEHFGLLGITAYHEAGYTGTGINIFNGEEDIDGTHGHSTRVTLERVVPNANIISATTGYTANNDDIISINVNLKDELGKNIYVPLEDFVNDYDVHLSNFSVVHLRDESYLYSNYLGNIQDSYIFNIFNSAGNNGYDPNFEDTTMSFFPYENAFNIGAVDYSERYLEMYPDDYGFHRARYSSGGEQVDFVSLTTFLAGTSFSSPVLTGMSALIQERYGLMHMATLYEFLKMISLDLGEEGKDNEYGWGIPILPDPNEILIKLYPNNKIVMVDKVPLKIDVEPFIYNDRTMIPVRFVSETLGADVFWNNSERKVVISKDGNLIQMTIGNPNIIINGETIVSDVAPMIVDSRTMLPLRIIAEALEARVGWVEKEREVLILD